MVVMMVIMMVMVTRVMINIYWSPSYLSAM